MRCPMLRCSQCRNPFAALVILAVVFPNQNSLSFPLSGGLSCINSRNVGGSSNGGGRGPLLTLLFASKIGQKEAIESTFAFPRETPNKRAADADQETIDADQHADWIPRMMSYLWSERYAIFRGKTVAIFLSSSPAKECQAIASEISGIASEVADRLYFLVSPQEETDGVFEEAFCLSSNHNNEFVAKTIDFDFDQRLETKEIDVAVLSTRSWKIVHDDPFVNDFLRRTDAWIHMGSEFGDKFMYYSRLQEGANITLW